MKLVQFELDLVHELLNYKNKGQKLVRVKDKVLKLSEQIIKTSSLFTLNSQKFDQQI